MNATGLLLLILFIVALGVAIYYSFLCLQSEFRYPLKYSNTDHGPLLAHEPDFNGNHGHASAPVDPVDSKKESINLDLLSSQDAHASPSNEKTSDVPIPNIKPPQTPECAAKNTVNNSTIIDINDAEAPEIYSRESEPLLNKMTNTNVVLSGNFPGPASEGDLEDGLFVPRSPHLDDKFVSNNLSIVVHHNKTANSQIENQQEFESNLHLHAPLTAVDISNRKGELIPATTNDYPDQLSDLHPTDVTANYSDFLPSAPIEDLSDAQVTVENPVNLGGNGTERNDIPKTERAHSLTQIAVVGKASCVGKSSSEQNIKRIECDYQPVSETIVLTKTKDVTPSPSISSSSDTSDPEVTEYSFLTGHLDPSTNTVIANEIGFNTDIPVSCYSNLPEEDHAKDQEGTIHCIATLPANHKLLDRRNLEVESMNKPELLPLEYEAAYGTPPITPPEKANFVPSEDSGIKGHLHTTTDDEPAPSFIVIESHKTKRRRSKSSCSSTCSTSSSSSVTSTSSSEGSFHPNGTDSTHTPLEEKSSEKSKIPILKK